jgi:hypothetical protein
MNASAAVGLTVSTGRAVVVVLRGTRESPEMVVRYEIQLSDPWLRESSHPYHLELRNAGPEGEQARMRGCNAAEAAARRATRRLVDDMKAHGLEPCGAAIVAASLVDPARVTGAHARAHAEERKLYRCAVEAELEACGVPVGALAEKNVRKSAAARLGRSAKQLDEMLKRFVSEVGTPWRAPEKHAALGAWLCLPETAHER